MFNMERGTLGVVIRLSRLAGVAPYMRRAKDGVSKALFVLGLVIVTSISSYIVIYTMLKVINGNDDKRKNLMMLDIIRVVSHNLLVIVAMVGGCTSAKRIAHMVRNLKKLDKINENIRCNKLNVLGSTGIHYFIWIYMSGIFAMRVTDCFFKKSSSHSLLFEIFVVTVRVWVELCLLQIIMFSERVLATLRMINDTLHQLSIERHGEERNKYVHNKTLKPRLAFVYSRDDPAYFADLPDNINENVSQTDESQSVEYTIRQLSKYYTIICEIVRDTTDVNGLLLILALLNHMLHLEMITYQIILWISYENNLGFETIFLIYHDLGHVFGLFLMVDIFHQTHAEMERTELLVRCLKYENEPPLAVNNELDLFQRTLLLLNTTYSPLDMCTLDRPLLVKVFGMLISYLVIIITYGPKLDTIANKEMLESLRLTRKF